MKLSVSAMVITMSNHCTIILKYNENTRHLGITSSRIVVGGKISETSDSAEDHVIPPTRAWKTVFRFVLLLSYYKNRQESLVQLGGGTHWDKLRESFLKLARNERKGQLDGWATHFFGKIDRIEQLIDFRNTKSLHIKVGALGRADVTIKMAVIGHDGVEREAQDLENIIQVLGDRLNPDTEFPRLVKRRLDEIEPDEQIRQRLLLTAKDGLNISDLPPSWEFVLGKGVWLCKLQELHESVKWSIDFLKALKDELDVLLTKDKLELVETFADLSNAFRQLSNLRDYFDDQKMQGFVTSARGVLEKVRHVLDRRLTKGQDSSFGAERDSLLKSIEEAVDLGLQLRPALGVRVDGCRQKLRSYLLA